MLFHAGTLDDPNSDANTRRHLILTRELAIYMLTPGFSRAYHQHALGVSDTTVAKYVRLCRQFAASDPTIRHSISENLASITPEDGLRIAQRRGAAHLPWWSRLAIAEFQQRLGNNREVAALFNCSPRTVHLILTTCPIAYDPLSGERRLSKTQASPPGMWRRASHAL